MKKLQYIDSIRGIAVLGVLMVHCQVYGTNHYPVTLENIFQNGARGVQLFYIASAFTLFLSLTNRNSTEKNLNFNFFIRRFFRIAPMYYLGIIYYLYQNGFGPRYWLGDETHITNFNIASNFLFFHGFNPYWITSIVPGGWSIAVEMMFYCLVPFLFYRIKNLNQAVIFFIISLLFRWGLQTVLYTVHVNVDQDLWINYLFLYLPSQLPVFACGIMLFFLISTPKASWSVKPGMILILLIFFLAQVLAGKDFFPSHIQFGIAFGALVFALSRKPFLLLVNRITAYIGKVSYSMYLVHFAILYWMDKFNLVDLVPKNIRFFNVLNYGVRFTCLVILSVILSTITYNLIETPFQQLGKKIIRRFENAPSVQLNLPDENAAI